MAERKEKSQLIGDFLREAAVLVSVLMPLELYVQHGTVTSGELAFAWIGSGTVLYWGLILEGSDDL